jgi:hypothetical protein
MIASSSTRAALTVRTDKRGLASFPVVADWQLWWKTWGPKIAAQEGRQGWILFLLDANERLMEVSMLISRIIRSKPQWTTEGWSQDEWSNVQDVAARATAWFEANCPTKDLPEWAQFIAAAQYGNFRVLERLARELRALQEQGYTTVVLEETGGRTITVQQGAEKILEEVA